MGSGVAHQAERLARSTASISLWFTARRRERGRSRGGRLACGMLFTEPTALMMRANRTILATLQKGEGGIGGGFVLALSKRGTRAQCGWLMLCRPVQAAEGAHCISRAHEHARSSPRRAVYSENQRSRARRGTSMTCSTPPMLNIRDMGSGHNPR